MEAQLNDEQRMVEQEAPQLGGIDEAFTGLPKVGVPDFAGYAIGYRVVQQYLQRTGRSAVDATFLSSQEIIAESGFFE